jgi:hypothetical protein
MDVQLKPLGCVRGVGAVLSLGLLPLLLRKQERQFPAALSLDELILVTIG